MPTVYLSLLFVALLLLLSLLSPTTGAGRNTNTSSSTIHHSSSSSTRNNNNNGTTLVLQKPLEQQLACVRLLQYAHRDCKGHPIKAINKTVWTKPGSSCEEHGSNSVTDQYCDNLDTGNASSSAAFHQKVYIKSKKCKSLITKHLTFKFGKCTYGYMRDNQPSWTVLRRTRNTICSRFCI